MAASLYFLCLCGAQLWVLFSPVGRQVYARVAASLWFYACMVVNCLFYFRLCGGKFVFYACVALNCEFYLPLWGDKFMPVRRQVSTLCLCSGWIVNFYLRLCGGRLCLCGGRFAVICFCLACVAVSREYFFSPVWRWAIACVAVKLRVLFSPGWRWVPACVAVSCSFFMPVWQWIVNVFVLYACLARSVCLWH